MSEEIEDLNPAKIRWQCRRGMLELDIMLLSFFDAQYSCLTLADQQAFVRLLKESDPSLHALLSGSTVSSDPIIADIIRKITKHLCKKPNSI